MYFTTKHCQLVLDGTKTQTRRLMKPDLHNHDAFLESLDRDSVYLRLAPGSMENKRLKWQVGRRYGISPGRGRHSIGRFQLDAIRLESLQDITEQDAEEEGVHPDDLEGMAYHIVHQSIASPSCDPKLLLTGYIGAYALIWDKINSPGYRWIDNPTVWVLELHCVDRMKGWYRWN